MSQYKQDLENILVNCNRCGLCNAISPLFEIQKIESSTPRGKLRLARGIIQGELEDSGVLVDRIYECLMCGHCSSVCPAGIKVEEVIQSTREILAAKGLTPKTISAIVSNIELIGNIYGEDIESLSIPENDLVYFPGCISSSNYQYLAKPTIDCLSQAGLKVSVLKDICCGAPAWAAGFTEIYNTRSEKLKSLLEGKQAITGCPHCYYFLKQKHIQVQHVSQVYAEVFKNVELYLPKSMKDTFTYSDPCYLARFSNIVNEPRELLARIWNLELIEMKSNKKNTKCCGSGLELVHTAYPTLAEGVALNKLKEATDVEAKTLITYCPHCYQTLKHVAHDNNIPIKIKDFSQLLAQIFNQKTIQINKT